MATFWSTVKKPCTGQGFLWVFDVILRLDQYHLK
jgi:hypothetical protein